MADDFMEPVYTHIINHVVRHHPTWAEDILSANNFEERMDSAKKLVRRAARETKDPYMRSESAVRSAAFRLYSMARKTRS